MFIRSGTIAVVHCVMQMHHKDEQFIGNLDITMTNPLITDSEPNNKGRFPALCLTFSSFIGLNFGPEHKIPT